MSSRLHKQIVILGVIAMSGAGVFVAWSTGGRSGDARDPAPRSPEEIQSLYRAGEDQPRFDGEIHGWRLGPEDALAREGVADRNLTRSCEPVVPDGVETNLDFTLTYLPPPPEFSVAEAPRETKWICDGDGLSVTYFLTIDGPYGEAGLRVERAVWGRRALELDAPRDRVEGGEVNSLPAILVHPAEDDSGIGQAQVIVLEENDGPEFVILRAISDDGIPFDELVKIVEGVR